MRERRDRRSGRRRPVSAGGARGLTGALALCLAAASALARASDPAPAEPLTGPEKLARQQKIAAAECARYDGVFSLAPGAVTKIDLTGDREPEMIVDFRFFSCSTVHQLYCATDACPLQVHEGGATTTWRALDWRLVEWGPDRVLMMMREGDVCGASTPEICYEAAIWRNGRFLTAGPIPQ